jgi:hypothetical protein
LCGTLNQTTIEVPPSLASAATVNSRPFVYRNGLLIDPRECAYGGAPVVTSIRLTGGIALQPGDVFTVLMLNVTPPFFYIPNVSA